MIHENIQLLGKEDVYLTTYLHAESTQGEFQIKHRPAVIVIPGGAYAYMADDEAEPVALTFLKEGYNTFVLHYSVGDKCTYPEILEEVSSAIVTVRKHAKEWNINPDGIVLMGFSAGACLAAMSATQWNKEGLAEKLGVDKDKTKPNAVVISYGAWDNTNTIQKDPKYFNPKAAKIAKDCTPELDFINYVGEHVPPMFIWHTRNDKYVPVINPLMIGAKLLELDKPFELHIFDGGCHGMSVCNSLNAYCGKREPYVKEYPNVGYWVSMCTNWLNHLFEI